MRSAKANRNRAKCQSARARALSELASRLAGRNLRHDWKSSVGSFPKAVRTCYPDNNEGATVGALILFDDEIAFITALEEMPVAAHDFVIVSRPMDL
jgi:hypothetical protein